jgi:hypothetical protein
VASDVRSSWIVRSQLLCKQEAQDARVGYSRLTCQAVATRHVSRARWTQIADLRSHNPPNLYGSENAARGSSGSSIVVPPSLMMILGLAQSLPAVEALVKVRV